MLNLLKRTMTYPGFEPGTFGLAVSIANHCTIQVVIYTVILFSIHFSLKIAIETFFEWIFKNLNGI
jgi:hypothetical protein